MRILIIALFTAMLMTGCVGKVYHDGVEAEEYSLLDQVNFLLGKNRDGTVFVPDDENKHDDNAPLTPADYREKAAAMRKHLEDNPGICRVAREGITNHLDNIHGRYDDIITCMRAFIQIELLLEEDRKRPENNQQVMDYMRAAVGNALYEERIELKKMADLMDEYREKLADAVRLSELTWAAHDAMPDFSNKSSYPKDEDAKSAEEDYARQWVQSRGGFLPEDQAWEFIGISSLKKMRKDLSDSYYRNRARDWMRNLNNGLYNDQIPGLMKRMEILIEGYQLRYDRSMELLLLYYFLHDDGKCQNHLSAYHFSEATYAFKGHDIDLMQEDFRNKVRSYGSGVQLGHFEDDNFLNMLLYAGIDPATYEDIHFLQDYGWLGEILKKHGSTLPIDRINEITLDIQIVHSGALLLPPVFMYDADHKGKFAYIDGGRDSRRHDFSSAYSAWSDWANVREFYRGGMLSRQRFGGNTIGNMFGGVIGGHDIMDNYSGPGGQSRLIYYDMEYLTFSRYLDVLFKAYEEKSRTVYTLGKLCRKHMISYHTIEPELITYITEKGKNYGEFTNKYSSNPEDLNIRNFVRFFEIPREDFAELFYDERWLQPYNIDAVYGTDQGAIYYFDFSYRMGFNVEYRLNGASGTPPAKRVIPVDAIYTIAAAPERVGYRFIEWNTLMTGAGKGVAEYSAQRMDAPGAHVTYHAQWERIPYTLSYDMNGGRSDPPEDSLLFYEDKFFTPMHDGITPPRGMVLSVWSNVPDPHTAEAQGLEFEIYQPGSAHEMPPRDLTLYAIWEETTYTVTYDLNGARAGIAPTEEPKKDGEPFIIAKHEGFTAPDDARFMGWNTMSDGSGAYYQPGSTFTIDERSVTLYAIWRMLYTITFERSGFCNDQLGTLPEPIEVEPGSTITIPFPDVNLRSRDGSRRWVSGWSPSSAYAGWGRPPEFYAPGDTIEVNRNMTLYPHWE